MFLRIIILLILAIAPQALRAQSTMSLEECMRYAAEHSFTTSRAALATANAEIDHRASKLNFLPSLSAGVGANANFGRGIDPQTNNYITTSTFNNSMSVSSSLLLFDGFRLINQSRRAKAAKLQGMASEEVARDNVAEETMALYAEVLYYGELVDLHRLRIENFSLQERQIARKEELGGSSTADLAQIRASLAQEEYSAVNAENNYQQSLIKLKDIMNFPLSDTLHIQKSITPMELESSNQSLDSIVELAMGTNAEVVASGYALEQAKLDLAISQSALSPSIGLEAGVATSFFTNLNGGKYDSYGTQLSGNLGQWVGATLSIPIFNRWQSRANISKTKNNLRQAEADHNEKLRTLQSTILQVEMELRAAYSAWSHAKSNVEYQTIATNAALREWKIDKISIIELQTSQNELLKSQIEEKYSYLRYQIKLREMNYYKGVPYIQ